MINTSVITDIPHGCIIEYKFSFQVIKLLGRTWKEAGGESSPCLPARASQVSGKVVFGVTNNAGY